MKRLLWLLAAVTLFLAACGGATSESVAPTAETYGGEGTAPAATAVSSGDTQAAETTAPEATTAADPNDPTQVRDRDWKLNDVTDPAVTVIEYGDFQ